MAVELKAGDCTLRLADQLQTLSEVAETLTFRLLELEERMAAHELKLQPVLAGVVASGELDGDTELRLGETEDRLARLEGLLSGLESPAAARHLHSVVAGPVQHAFDADAEDAVAEELLDEQEFAEEQPVFAEEQAFLDELSA